MKNIFYSLLFIVSFGFSQDFEIQLNRSGEIPTLPDSMTFEEFSTINRHLGWKELFTSVIYPGYNHNYIDEDSSANAIRLYRLGGVALITAAMVDFTFFGQHEITTSNLVQVFRESPRDGTMFMLGMSVNLFLAIYDWGHAQLILKDKQEKILYKYHSKKSQ